LSHSLEKTGLSLIVKCAVCLGCMFADTATALTINAPAMGYTGLGSVIYMSGNAGQSYQGRPARPVRIAAPALGYTGFGGAVAARRK